MKAVFAILIAFGLMCLAGALTVVLTDNERYRGDVVGGFIGGIISIALGAGLWSLTARVERLEQQSPRQ